MLSRQEQNTLYNLDKTRIMRFLKNQYPKYDIDAIYNDVMYKAIIKYDQYQGGDNNEKLLGWIWTILHRTVVDHMRMNRRYFDNVIMPEKFDRGYNDAHHGFIYSNYTQKLMAYLPTQKHIDIFTDFIEGYSHKELSEKHNIPTGTSKWFVFDSRRIINSKIQLNSWMSKYL